MTKTKGRKRKTRYVLSIYQITTDIYELRISGIPKPYVEKLYMGLTELRAFLSLALVSIDVEKAIRTLASKRYFVHEYR